MRTFPRIDDEALLIEAIRRLSPRKKLAPNETAPQGTKFETLLKCYEIFGGLKREVLQSLIESGDVVMTGVVTIHSQKRREEGIVSKLHPDAKIGKLLFFTESGTPIIAKYTRNEYGGVTRTHPTENNFYSLLRIERLYVTSDGLPESIKRQKIGIQPYL